jgi:hypothetical protein
MFNSLSPLLVCRLRLGVNAIKALLGRLQAGI